MMILPNWLLMPKAMTGIMNSGRGTGTDWRKTKVRLRLFQDTLIPFYKAVLQPVLYPSMIIMVILRAV